MMENAVQKYKVYNPKNSNCPVCTMLNSIYKANLFQKEMKIPEEAGKGYYRRIILKPSMEVFIADATFSEGMTMGGGPSNPEYCLAFCLGEAFRWRLEGNKKEYEIECGENYIFHGNKGNSICSYNPGQRFYGLTVHLDSEIIASFIHHMGKDTPVSDNLMETVLFTRENFRRLSS